MRDSFFENKNLTLKEKIFNIDFKLFFLIILLGIISVFAMYSTEQGNIGYYTQSHLYRFSIFFVLFIILSFFRINTWYKSAYLFYLVVLILLLAVHFFGVTSSGSQRWLNLLVINIQPSELMKIGLIIFLARYYNQIPSHEVNRIKFLILPVIVLIIPMWLVISQPDLGTSILIAAGSIAVMFLAGLRLKYLFIFSFLF